MGEKDPPKEATPDPADVLITSGDDAQAEKDMAVETDGGSTSVSSPPRSRPQKRS